MFPDSDLISIFGPALIIVIILGFSYKLWIGKQENELAKALTLLKISIFSTAFLSVVLWMMLPSTSSLSTFGFPETVQQISESEQLLTYIQDHNKAIVRTTEVIYWFLFMFVWWFLLAVYTVTRAFSTSKEEGYFDRRKSKIAKKIDEKKQSSL